MPGQACGGGDVVCKSWSLAREVPIRPLLILCQVKPFVVHCAERDAHCYETARAGVAPYNFVRLSNCALSATTTVLADIKTAPSAGVRRMSHRASTPAASGMATML